ncbi:nucleoside phosphorylase domain-containing protein [Aspergillus undulatus]|uniref:nucleoside phosphorylase domain-containing protein n=1 Tax=Aspergillus undulatus TaxID=1810928 RepID=UPI003CCCC755
MLSHDDYIVGWVCALPLELTAAIAMLDETHPQLSRPESDQNAYALGSIAGHNSVIACLPSGVYRTVSPATVLSQMLATFPQLRFTLMVCIGGGVPIPSSGHDIRLGDVVVSKPTESCGGVVQYDLGKALQGSFFEQIGSLNHPPQVLLTHMSLPQATMADSKDEDYHIIPLVQTALDHRPQLIDEFSCHGPQNDVLFNSLYPHNTGTEFSGACLDCDQKQVVQRKPRTSMEPRVHYGTIASGNQVIKDSETRDRLARELNVLCFEMVRQRA